MMEEIRDAIDAGEFRHTRRENWKAWNRNSVSALIL